MHRPGPRRAVAALQFPAFRLLFLSQVVSSIGGQLQNITNTWQIFEITGSALQIGLTGVARAVPTLAFSLVGGVIADRFDRRRIIMSTQIMNGLFGLFLGIMTATGRIEVWHIYLVTFLNASLMALSNPARQAIVTGLVPRDQLLNALALQQTVNQTSNIIAPSLGGVLIAAIGLPISYYINGAATFITAVLLHFLKIPPLPARPKSSPLEDLAEGLRYVRRRRLILSLLSTDLASQVFGSYQPLLPIIADRFAAGVVGFGVLSSAPSAGAVIGAFTVMMLADVRYKGFWIVGAILLYCLCLIGLALSPWFGLACIFAAGLGFTNTMQATPRNTVILLSTPDALRGRVSAFRGMLSQSGPSIGQAVMGAATVAIGASVALIAGALTCIAINIGIIAKDPELRSEHLAMEADEEVDAEIAVK